jgi:hypothetical protein
MSFNPDRLAKLGNRHNRLRADLAALVPELHEEIRAATAAGMPQSVIAKATGYTRDQVRQITLPPERRRRRPAPSRSVEPVTEPDPPQSRA